MRLHKLRGLDELTAKHPKAWKFLSGQIEADTREHLLQGRLPPWRAYKAGVLEQTPLIRFARDLEETVQALRRDKTPEGRAEWQALFHGDYQPRSGGSRPLADFEEFRNNLYAHARNFTDLRRVESARAWLKNRKATARKRLVKLGVDPTSVKGTPDGKIEYRAGNVRRVVEHQTGTQTALGGMAFSYNAIANYLARHLNPAFLGTSKTSFRNDAVAWHLSTLKE